MAQPVLDLSGIPAGQHDEAVARAFDALAPGESVTIVTRVSPRNLIKRLIAERWGRFDWSPAAADGVLFHSLLRKRERPAEATIEGFLTEDHRRCDTLFADAEAAALAGDLARTRELFEGLNLGMRRHFAMEEEGFFPDFDARSGMAGSGPTEAMRSEHEQMRSLLDELATRLSSGDLDGYAAASETMTFLMEQHNLKEEQMLYPPADELFGPEAESVVKRLHLF
jgi:uncharacterized protein (DUF2249 family)